MKCPTLNELPPPPPEKTGWPWTEATQPLPEKMPDGSEWPKISIVTPNYNYGHFLEETIRSILLQGFPNLEYIIIDGGSIDQSIEIIQKYEAFISYWTSEPDKGQANAINKGLEKCNGEIFNWINADDFLTRGSLKAVSESIKHANAVAGSVHNFGEFFGKSIDEIISCRNLSAYSLIIEDGSSVFHQPGLWLRTDKLRAIGGLNESFNFSFDWDMAIRYLANFPSISYTSKTLVNFRCHEISKSTEYYSILEDKFCEERVQILNNILKDTKFSSIHDAIRLLMRKKDWHESVTHLLDVSQASKLEKICVLLFNSWFDPQVRWQRFTLGALRKILLS